MADEQTPLLNNYLEQERNNGMNIQQERYGVFEQYTEFNLDARLYATVLIEQFEFGWIAQCSNMA